MILCLYCNSGFANNVILPPDSGEIFKEQKKSIDTLIKEEGYDKEVKINQVGESEKNSKNENENNQYIQINVIEVVEKENINIFKKESLNKILKEYVGRKISFKEMSEVTEKIEKFYHEQGYILAKAYLPEQEISNGVLKINVVIGVFGQIILNNKSKVNDYVLKNQMAMLSNGKCVNKFNIDRVLLLINDLPGVYAKATLNKGGVEGVVDLTIEATSIGKKYEKTFLFNDYGNYYTGEFQSGVVLKLNNLSNKGDYFLISSLVGSSSNVISGYLVYDTPIGKDGDKFNFSYSRSNYLLSKTFSVLNSTGIADSLSLSWRKTIIRSKKHNVYLVFNYQNKELYDRLGIINYNTKKSVDELNVIYTDNRIDDAGNGYTSFSFTYNYGHLYLNSAAMVNATPGAPGDYATVAMTYNRYKRFLPKFSYMINFNAQWANENLNSSEKMTLGGPYGVRAYPVGEASGDVGFLGQAELYYHFPSLNDMRAVLFFDAGSVRNAKSYEGINGYQSCVGYGIGFILNTNNGLSLRIDYALKSNPNQISTAAPDRNGRFWWQATYNF